MFDVCCVWWHCVFKLCCFSNCWCDFHLFTKKASNICCLHSKCLCRYVLILFNSCNIDYHCDHCCTSRFPLKWLSQACTTWSDCLICRLATVWRSPRCSSGACPSLSSSCHSEMVGCTVLETKGYYKQQ